MGSSNSHSAYNKKQLRNTHPNQQKSVLVEQGDKHYIQSSFRMDEKHYNHWRSGVESVSKTPYNSFLYLPQDMGYVKNDKLCGNSVGYAVVNYPEHPFLLSDEIARKKLDNTYFKEKELYYLLYALVASKNQAEKRKEPLGDIRPENVFISHDEKIRVSCLHSFPYEQEAYKKLVDSHSPCYKVFVAPEDLRAATQGKLDNHINDRSEIFNMGITVISAGLLDDMLSMYDYPNRKFIYEEHNKKTVQWLEHPHYSEIFKSIVLSMVNPIPEKRISTEELWSFLHQHEHNILARAPFVINNPPNLIESGVSIVRSSIMKSGVRT